MRRVAIPLAVTLALAVSGCWISEEPLMPASAEDMPELDSRYAQLDPDGAEAGQALIEVFDGQISLTLERGSQSKQLYALRFDNLFDNWYLVQAMPEADDNAEKLAIFRLLRQQGDQWFEFDPDCGEELAKLTGVERSGGDCKFSNYAALVTAATSEARKIDRSGGTAGELSGSYVPERPGR